MPLDFPSSPTNGQVYDRYTYNSALGVWKLTVSSVLPAANGGTGITSYTTGDILYASGTTTLDKLPSVTSGYVLTSNGSSTAPSWQVATGGTTTNPLTIGTGLSGTSFNGSSAVTIAIDSTVATLTGTQTLTNKTLTSPTMTTPSIGVATGTSFNSITGLASTTSPMDGTAAVGTGTTVARADHVHPTDTSRAATSGTLAQFAATTSAQLAGVISDETGSGSLVFANTPTLVTPVLGAATGTSISLTGGSLTTRAAATQDGIIFSGRAGGTTTLAVTLIPATLTSSRTLTLPDVTGTIVTTGDTGTVTSAMILNGTIVNDDINASAAIAYSKLSLANSIVNADIGTSAAIAVSKLAASTISGVTLGNNLNALTIGTGLSGTSYNGSSSVTVTIDSTVATLTGSQTLTNKTLGSSTSLGSDLSAATYKITGLGTPTAATDAATKQYVDDVAQGLHIHPSVVAATTANLTATYANGTAGVGATLTNTGTLAAFSIDGVSPAQNDRILVKNQTTQLQNGIYTLTTVGSGSVAWVLTRATDMDQSVEVDGGDFVFVTGGSTLDNTGWVQTETSVTIGTNNIIFTQFSGAGTYAAGNGLTLTGSTFSINTSITADLSTAQTFTNKTINGSSNTITNVSLTSGVTGTLPVASGGTGITSFGTGIATFLGTPSSANLAAAVTDETGSGSLVFATSPTLTTPSIGVATGTSFNSITGLSSTTPIVDGTAAVGTATTTARADHVHPTDTSRAATSGTLAQFAATTSSQLAGVISDETGSGSLVFATSPTLVTPSLGVATGTSFNSITGLSSTTPIVDGTAAVGTATTTARADHVHPTDTSRAATSGTLAQFAATTSAQLAGVISDETGSGLLVFATSPTLTTPTLGVATATSINKMAITAPATSSTLAVADGKTFTASNTITLSGTDSSTLNIGSGGTLGTGAFATIANYALLSGATFTGQIQSTLANSTTTGGGQIYLNGATGNRIDFNINGTSAPAFTTRSVGTKIVLYPLIGGSTVDYALGIEGSHMWSSVEQATSAYGFKWYGGTTNVMTLRGNGTLSLNSTSSTLGSSSTTHQLGVVSGAAANVAMVIRGAASQTGDLLQVQDSAGTVMASIISGGTARFVAFRAGQYANQVDGTHTASIVPQNVNTLALLVKGLTSQVSNIQEWHNSSGTAVATMSATGAFTATTKSFDIPHPTKEKMRLRYGSLEGPENGVYVRGNTKNNVIELPDYWTGLVDESTITVTLTSIGKFQKVYLEKIEDNKIYIGGRVKEISYIIFGERKDVDKLTVEY
jgi:hypothetical protein